AATAAPTCTKAHRSPWRMRRARGWRSSPFSTRNRSGPPARRTREPSRSHERMTHGFLRWRRTVALVVTVAVAAGAGACATAGSSAPASAPGATPSTESSTAAARTGPALDIAYSLTLTDTAGHYYDVRMDIAGALPDTLRVQMPVWSPGRYARMDLARNVRGETVQDANGRAVRFDRENGSLWRIYPAGARSVSFRYQVFANTLS